MTTASRRVLTQPTSQTLKDPNEPVSGIPTSGSQSTQVGTADTTTPLRPGSARRSKEALTNHRSGSKSKSTVKPVNNPPASPTKSTQLEMDRYLEDEMRNGIFCDPNFVTNFLAIETDKQQLLDTKFPKQPKKVQGMRSDISAECRLYKPILDVICSIKTAVDTVQCTYNQEVLGTNFEDRHSKAIPGDDPETQLIKPDLVLFERDIQRQWATVMMPIEVKAKHAYLKVGIKQLTRYARAVFAHQIHRRHLYGMVICKWRATFVRFDRSGILHSPAVDMLRNPNEFRQAFAGLMMMDRSAFGYDTSFTVEPGPGRQLEYYVDLPAAALLSPPDTGPNVESAPTAGGSNVGATPDPAHSQRLASRRFQVMERLCHRKSIRGRATIVLRLREVRQSTGPPGRRTRRQTRAQTNKPKWEEVPEQPDYVLKVMWRDPNKRQEGAMLKCLEGEYGVVQCRWFSDVLRQGSDCHDPGASSCDKCHDVTPAQAAVWQMKNLQNIDVDVAAEEDGNEPQYGKHSQTHMALPFLTPLGIVEVDTEGYTGELYTRRMARIYSWSLFSTVGRLLWTAESPYQFLKAVLDAVLGEFGDQLWLGDTKHNHSGYWHAFNRGILHRDISDGNVLIAEPGKGYHLRKWMSSPGAMTSEDQQAGIHPLAESRRLAQEMVKQLGRDPSGFLSDYDLATTHNGMESELFGHTHPKDGGCNSRTLDAEDPLSAGPAAKRPRREVSSTLPSLGTGRGRENTHSGELGILPAAGPSNKTFKHIDFRTVSVLFFSGPDHNPSFFRPGHAHLHVDQDPRRQSWRTLRAPFHG